MAKRVVIVGIDDITNIFKDYLTEEYLPRDAKPVKLMVNPKANGKLGLLIESDSLEGEGQMAVDFDIKRFFGGLNGG